MDKDLKWNNIYFIIDILIYTAGLPDKPDLQ